MRYRVNLLRVGASRDQFGGTGSPVAFATRWAKLQPLSGKELFKAQQTVAEVTHKVTIRYMPGVKANQLVQFGSRIFEIQYIENIEFLNLELHLFCLERNDGNSVEQVLYLVSGTIANGAGASVDFFGPSGVTVIADATGNFSALLHNGTYTITPTLSGLTMTPLNQSVTVASAPITGVNFTAA